MSFSINRRYLIVARDMAKGNMAETCLRFGLDIKTCEKISTLSLVDIEKNYAENIRFKPVFDAKLLERLISVRDVGTRGAMILVNRHGSNI